MPKSRKRRSNRGGRGGGEAGHSGPASQAASSSSASENDLSTLMSLFRGRFAGVLGSLESKMKETEGEEPEGAFGLFDDDLPPEEFDLMWEERNAELEEDQDEGDIVDLKFHADVVASNQDDAAKLNFVASEQRILDELHQDILEDRLYMPNVSAELKELVLQKLDILENGEVEEEDDKEEEVEEEESSEKRLGSSPPSEYQSEPKKPRMASTNSPEPDKPVDVDKSEVPDHVEVEQSATPPPPPPLPKDIVIAQELKELSEGFEMDFAKPYEEAVSPITEEMYKIHFGPSPPDTPMQGESSSGQTPPKPIEVSVIAKVVEATSLLETPSNDMQSSSSSSTKEKVIPLGKRIVFSQGFEAETSHKDELSPPPPPAKLSQESNKTTVPIIGLDSRPCSPPIGSPEVSIIFEVENVPVVDKSKPAKTSIPSSTSVKPSSVIVSLDKRKESSAHLDPTTIKADKRAPVQDKPIDKPAVPIPSAVPSVSVRDADNNNSHSVSNTKRPKLPSAEQLAKKPEEIIDIVTPTMNNSANKTNSEDCAFIIMSSQLAPTPDRKARNDLREATASATAQRERELDEILRRSLANGPATKASRKENSAFIISNQLAPTTDRKSRSNSREATAIAANRQERIEMPNRKPESSPAANASKKVDSAVIISNQLASSANRKSRSDSRDATAIIANRQEQVQIPNRTQQNRPATKASKKEDCAFTIMSSADGKSRNRLNETSATPTSRHERVEISNRKPESISAAAPKAPKTDANPAAIPSLKEMANNTSTPAGSGSNQRPPPRPATPVEDQGPTLSIEALVKISLNSGDTSEECDTLSDSNVGSSSSQPSTPPEPTPEPVVAPIVVLDESSCSSTSSSSSSSSSNSNTSSSSNSSSSSSSETETHETIDSISTSEQTNQGIDSLPDSSCSRPSSSSSSSSRASSTPNVEPSGGGTPVFIEAPTPRVEKSCPPPISADISKGPSSSLSKPDPKIGVAHNKSQVATPIKPSEALNVKQSATPAVEVAGKSSAQSAYGSISKGQSPSISMPDLESGNSKSNQLSTTSGPHKTPSIPTISIPSTVAQEKSKSAPTTGNISKGSAPVPAMTDPKRGTTNSSKLPSVPLETNKIPITGEKITPAPVVKPAEKATVPTETAPEKVAQPPTKDTGKVPSKPATLPNLKSASTSTPPTKPTKQNGTSRVRESQPPFVDITILKNISPSIAEKAMSEELASVPDTTITKSGSNPNQSSTPQGSKIIESVATKDTISKPATKVPEKSVANPVAKEVAPEKKSTTVPDPPNLGNDLKKKSTPVEAPKESIIKKSSIPSVEIPEKPASSSNSTQPPKVSTTTPLPDPKVGSSGNKSAPAPAPELKKPPIPNPVGQPSTVIAKTPIRSNNQGTALPGSPSKVVVSLSIPTIGRTSSSTSVVKSPQPLSASIIKQIGSVIAKAPAKPSNILPTGVSGGALREPANKVVSTSTPSLGDNRSSSSSSSKPVAGPLKTVPVEQASIRVEKATVISSSQSTGSSGAIVKETVSVSKPPTVGDKPSCSPPSKPVEQPKPIQVEQASAKVDMVPPYLPTMPTNQVANISGATVKETGLVSKPNLDDKRSSTPPSKPVVEPPKPPQNGQSKTTTEMAQVKPSSQTISTPGATSKGNVTVSNSVPGNSSRPPQTGRTPVEPSRPPPKEQAKTIVETAQVKPINLTTSTSGPTPTKATSTVNQSLVAPGIKDVSGGNIRPTSTPRPPVESSKPPPTTTTPTTSVITKAPAKPINLSFTTSGSTTNFTLSNPNLSNSRSSSPSSIPIQPSKPSHIQHSSSALSITALPLKKPSSSSSSASKSNGLDSLSSYPKINGNYGGQSPGKSELIIGSSNPNQSSSYTSTSSKISVTLVDHKPTVIQRKSELKEREEIPSEPQRGVYKQRSSNLEKIVSQINKTATVKTVEEYTTSTGLSITPVHRSAVDHEDFESPFTPSSSSLFRVKSSRPRMLVPPPPKLTPRPIAAVAPNTAMSSSHNGGHPSPSDAVKLKSFTITPVPRKMVMIPPPYQPDKKIYPLFQCQFCPDTFLCYDDNLFKIHLNIKHGFEIDEDKHFSQKRKITSRLWECTKCRTYVLKTDEHRLTCPFQNTVPSGSEFEMVEVVEKRLLKHECGICFRSFSARYELRRHIEGSHKHLLPKLIFFPGFRCSKCLQGFESSFELTKHCQDCDAQCPKPDTIYEVAKRYLYCDICDKSHASTNEATNCYEKKSILRCTLCFDIFKHKDNFYKHLRAYHGLQLLKGPLTLACPYCNSEGKVNWGKYQEIFPHIANDHFQPRLDEMSTIHFSNSSSATGPQTDRKVPNVPMMMQQHQHSHHPHLGETSGVVPVAAVTSVIGGYTQSRPS